VYNVALGRTEPDLLAQAPGEVGAVVILHQRFKSVGTYTTGGDAQVAYCTMTVVDVARGKAIAEKTFVGAKPPRTVSAPMGTDVVGDLPFKRMFAWVARMARD